MSERERAIELLADALSMNASEIDDSVTLADTEQWDSLAHMRLIMALESSIGQKLDAEMIVSVASFEAVVTLLEKHSTSAQID